MRSQSLSGIDAGLTCCRWPVRAAGRRLLRAASFGVSVPAQALSEIVNAVGTLQAKAPSESSSDRAGAPDCAGPICDMRVRTRSFHPASSPNTASRSLGRDAPLPSIGALPGSRHCSRIVAGEQPVAVFRERRVISDRVVDAEPDKPAKQEIELPLESRCWAGCGVCSQPRRYCGRGCLGQTARRFGSPVLSQRCSSLM